MARGRFSASVQYNDWMGSVAADHHDERSIRAVLKERKLIGEQDFIVATRLWVGETHGSKPPPPVVEVLIVELPEGEKLDGWLQKQSDPINVRMVELELTLEQFVALFKRFEAVLYSPHLGLEEREYKFPDE